MKTLRRFWIFGATALLATSAFSIVEAAGNAQQPAICVRSCWGARAPKSSISQMSALNRAVIHHTAGASDWNTTSQSTSITLVRAIQNLHMDSNGWSDIGYHFLTDKLGNRFEGRSGSMSSRPRGAHDGTNTNSFGFTLMAYCHPPYNHNPPLAMRNALYDTIAWRMPNGWSPYGSSTYNGRSAGFLCGHRDVDSTACPGDVYYNNYLGSNVNGGEARNAVNTRINGAPAIELSVDNTSGDFVASSSWFSSTSVTGYIGADYDARLVSTPNDPAAWNFLVEQEGNYEVFVRWTAASNRATSAPYTVYHASGSNIVTYTLNANQTVNGGQWMSLGTFWFFAGYGKRVELGSNGAPAGSYVVADAVKMVKR